MPNEPSNYEDFNFYDDETKPCYVYRAKQFKSFLDSSRIKYEYGFYAAESYIFFRILNKDLSHAQRFNIRQYIDENEDVGYEADDESEEGKPNVKRILISAYLYDGLDIKYLDGCYGD